MQTVKQLIEDLQRAPFQNSLIKIVDNDTDYEYDIMAVGYSENNSLESVSIHITSENPIGDIKEKPNDI